MCLFVTEIQFTLADFVLVFSLINGTLLSISVIVSYQCVSLGLFACA